MKITNSTIITSCFKEMIAYSNAEINNNDLDIIIENEITPENYCLALLHKFNKMPLSHYSNFINHQISLVSDQCKWLSNLEELIHRNEASFTSKTAVSKYTKIFHLIEQKQIDLQFSSVRKSISKTPKRLINADTEERYFSFYEIRHNIEKLENFNEKIMFLTEEIFEYRHADIISINAKLLEYDLQCEQLIEKLQTIRELKSEFEKEQNIAISNQLRCNKMRFNGNLNQLVDVFYQLQRELFVDGKPYIDGNINDMVAIIVNSFVDKDGKEISPETVKTILTPSRIEKRPKRHKRLDIDKLL